MTMKFATLVGASVAAMAMGVSPALADCTADLDSLAAYVADPPADASAAAVEQAREMIKPAREDCDAGAEDASQAVIAEIKQVLGL